MNEKTKQDIALLRVAVLGELVGADLDHGDLRQRCLEAAQKRWIWPDGTPDTVAARTVQNWYYAYKKLGFKALLPRDRSDLGISDIRPKLADFLIRAKLERPRRSLVRLIKMMVRAKLAAPGELSRSSVHRLLSRHNISGRPKRGPSAERRAFIYEHVGELLIGDALHVRRKVIVPGIGLRKVFMLSQIDCATRFIPESFFALSEGSANHEKGFKQVLLTHGRWRKYYVDLGAAYIARSLRIICAELDIDLLHTGPRDAEAKAAIERWHRTWRDEVEDELPDSPILLSELEKKHQAWLACEYHARKHDTTQRIPKEHFIEQCDRLRPIPESVNINEIFLHRADRAVSKVGTVRWNGGYLEVSPELCEKTVELRYDPSHPEDLPRVFVDGRFICDTVHLNLFKNAHRKRRRDLGAANPMAKPTGLDPLGDMVREHNQLTEPQQILNEKEIANNEFNFEFEDDNQTDE